MAGERVVAQRPALHPLLEAARVDLVGIEAHREQPADERAHADACDPVDDHAPRGELLEDADVRERPRAAPGEDDADGAPGQPPGRARDVLVELGRAQDVRLDGVQHRRPGVERASSGSDVVCDELAAVQLAPAGDRGRRLAARRHEEDAVRLLEAELRPGVVARRIPGVEDHEVVLGLGAIEQRAVAGGRALSVDRRRRVARVEQGRGQVARERVGEPPGDRVQRYALVDRDDGHRRRSRAHEPGRRAHPAELLGERSGQGERQRGGGVKQLLEVGAIDGEQIGCARRPHRRRARLAGEQRELADGVAAADLADRRSGGLVDDLHAAGADDVERVPDIALVEQPGAGGHAHGARAFRHRVAEGRLEGGEHRHLREELRGRLGPRRQRRRRIDAHQPPRGGQRGRGRRGRRLVDQHGTSRGRQRRLLVSRPAPDEEAAEPGDDEARGAEGPGAVERRGGLGGGGCPEDRDDERDAQCRADLACDGVQAGRRGVLRSRGRGDRRRGQVREQRAGAEPEEHDAGQPLAHEVRGQADARDEPEDGRAPEQPAGDEHRTRPDPRDEVARRPGHGGGDERARRQREARLEHGVVPHRGEEEDVDERVAVEPGAGDDRHRVGDAERPVAQERQVDDRRAMRRAAPGEDRSEHERRGERAQHPWIEPAPFRALDDRQDERRDRQRQHERALQVGHPPAAGRPALDQVAAREHDRRDADRHVDEEDEPPVADGDQNPAERGAEPGRRGGDGGQQRHAVRAALGRERVEHQGERRRDEQRRPERLEHAERRQRAGRRGDRAQHRRDREQLEPADEDPPPPDEIGQPSRRDEEGREDDVVGVEHPRQGRDRRVGIRARDVREGDVDDRGVDERHPGAHRRDRQHGARLRPAAAHRRRRRRPARVHLGGWGGGLCVCVCREAPRRASHASPCEQPPATTVGVSCDPPWSARACRSRPAFDVRRE